MVMCLHRCLKFVKAVAMQAHLSFKIFSPVDKQTIELLHKDARRAVSEHRLSDALGAAEGMAAGVSDVSAGTVLAEVREGYAMLLAYMERGVADSERHRLFAQFLQRTSEAVTALWRSYRLANETDLYGTTWRVLDKMQSTDWVLTATELEQNAQERLVLETEPASPQREAAQIRLRERYSSLYRNLFNSVWTSPAWRAGDAETALAWMASPSVSAFDKCVFVSAVGLGALEVFDARKVSFLLSLTTTPDVAVRVRAQVGGTLAFVAHVEECRLYPDLMAQWAVLSDEPGFTHSMLELQMQLWQSLDTKRVEKNLREEIFPEMMKRADRFRMDATLSADEAMEKAVEAGLNPEWESAEDMSVLEKKLRDLAELQQSGADVFMASFRMLKQKFPFFSSVVYWFCPFSPNHPELPPQAVDRSLLQMFLAPGHLCDSDKYSFLLMLGEMPAAQHRALSGQLAAAMEQHGEAMEQRAAEPLGAMEERRMYLQNLYRFFKLYNRRSGLSDPFAMNLQLLECEPIGDLLSSAQHLRQLADFAFKEKNYSCALWCYEQMPEAETDAIVWQKRGFCHHSAGHHAEAAVAYERANLLRPGSAWTLGRWAACLTRLSRHEEALRCYEELELITPDDISILLQAGRCYAHFERYDEAFERFFKADYLAPEDGRVQRAVAWYSLVAGKPEQAERYYAKLLAVSPSADDWQNAGHAAWVSGRVGEAVLRYRKAVGALQCDFPPVDFWMRDADVLARYGLLHDDLRLMADLVMQR